MSPRNIVSASVIALLVAACSGGASTGTGGNGGTGSGGNGQGKTSSAVQASTGSSPTTATGSDASGSSNSASANASSASATGSASSATATATTGVGSTSASSGAGGGGQAIQTVFLIMMENHSWSDIEGSNSAPYINNTLLSIGAHAEAYKTPTGNHPSEPNYIWLEAGSNLGITDDNPPSNNHQSTTNHLTTQLEAAGISWKAYAEGISGADCPQDDTGLFVVRHTPQLFFDDMTNSGSTTSAHCINHVRPYSELSTDLAANTVARFNFITPDVCHDMHGESFGTTCFALTANLIAEGDTWLSTEIPMIMASSAYQNGGAIFIVWDEGTEPFLQTASDGPLPFFAISPFAKAGHSGTVAYTHSSTLRSLQEIFGVAPFLGGAANATDLSDLFTTFP